MAISSGEDEAEGARPEADRVPRLQLRRAVELGAVEQRAVGGAEVAQVERAVAALELGVPARDLVVARELDLGVVEGRG